MDTPELGRLVVLQHAIISHLLSLAPKEFEPGFGSILRESDALVFRIAQRSRSAVGYHETTRGQAALADAEAVVELVKQEPKDFPIVTLVDMTWSLDQINGPIMPDMEKERKLERKMNVDGLRFVSPELRS